MSNPQKHRTYPQARSKRRRAPKQRKQGKRIHELPIVPDAEKVRGLYYPVPGVTPEKFFVEIGKLRTAAAERIESLIAFLDATEDTDTDEAVDDRPIDGDTDLEPILGSFDGLVNQVHSYQQRGCWDVEGDMEGDNDADLEPSLGWTNATNMSPGQCGGSDDREGEHDGCEPDEDGEPSLCGITADHITGNDRDLEDDDESEPSLGSLEHVDQSQWSRSSRSDREAEAV